jgi:hypothetical protein
MTTRPGPAGDAELVQRFVDQELTAEERVGLLSRLGRDESLRRRLLSLEQLSHAAAVLPRADLPPAFVAGVMRRIEAGPSAWERVRDLLWQPRVLEWNLARAAVVAAAMVAAVAGAWAVGSRRSADAVVATAAIAPPTVLVRLVISQPGARSVQVAGDFNGWNPAETPLEQLPSGAWAVTLPLEPGRYKYMFVVDGTMWVDDPFAVEQTDDGFGARNAVLDVRPPAAGAL